MAETEIISVEQEVTPTEEIQMEPQTMAPQALTMWNDSRLMKNAAATAKSLSMSTIIPENFRGKVGDCLIAIDMANRMGISPLMVMQSSQIVKGNFTWRGSACKAFIDGCGKFRESEFVQVGEPGTSSYGYYLQAVNNRTGKTVKGTTITMQMAIDEGWTNKNGSKWKTMPEQMLKYRAAAFFARSECPEVLMGCYTAEEIQDVKGYEAEQKTTVKFTLPSECKPSEAPDGDGK